MLGENIKLCDKLCVNYARLINYASHKALARFSIVSKEAVLEVSLRPDVINIEYGAQKYECGGTSSLG